MKEQEQLTIKEARDLIRPNLRHGTICPCCLQPTRMYSRPLTSSMAYGLIELYNLVKLGGDTWQHIENTFKELALPASIRGDLPKMRYWNLIEPKTGEKADNNPNNGYYRITETGKAFVENRIKVQSHVLLYNSKFYGFPKESKEISVIEALKNKFDYSKIVK